MKKMRFIAKIAKSILGAGRFLPAKEEGKENVYSLPDDVAAGLIATKDPDWEEVDKQSNQQEAGSAQEMGADQPSHKRRK